MLIVELCFIKGDVPLYTHIPQMCKPSSRSLQKPQANNEDAQQHLQNKNKRSMNYYTQANKIQKQT
jgi:hypothetical protein